MKVSGNLWKIKWIKEHFKKQERESLDGLSPSKGLIRYSNLSRNAVIWDVVWNNILVVRF